MSDEDRKWKQESLTNTLFYDMNSISGDVDELIEKLQSLKRQFPNHRELYLHVSQDYDEVYVGVSGERLETDAEYEARYTGCGEGGSSSSSGPG
jgi:hypothetical protein